MAYCTYAPSSFGEGRRNMSNENPAQACIKAEGGQPPQLGTSAEKELVPYRGNKGILSHFKV